MNSKHISKQSGEFLKYLNERNIVCFDNELTKKALPGSKPGAVKALLSDMTRRGLLMRIKKGLYYLIPYEQDPETFMPEWHTLSGYLVNGIDYYIGYYSALQLHNLITQPSLKEQIVVAKQIKPSELKVKGVPFQFIYHNQKHFFGITKVWIDNFTKVLCSDIEKTIIDCLFNPNYAGGIPEIARAIYISRNKINFNKLFDYVVRFDSQAVIKRLGFLLGVLNIETDITDELLKIKTKSIAVLDKELPKKGKFVSKWSILQNIDTETIKTTIFT